MAGHAVLTEKDPESDIVAEGWRSVSPRSALVQDGPLEVWSAHKYRKKDKLANGDYARCTGRVLEESGDDLVKRW